MKYRIGSFNLHRFGDDPNKDLDKIAEIILGEDLDVVAFQEVFGRGVGTRRLLEEYVRHRFYKWDIRCSKENGDFSGSGEGYAYIWNTRKFKLPESGQEGDLRFEPKVINDMPGSCGVFFRPPYYIRLLPCHGGLFELRLINIHIFHGDSKDKISAIERRQFEYKMLVQKIYPQINQEPYGNFRSAYTIAMGDYNLSIFRPYIQNRSKAFLSEVYNYSEGRESYQVITMQEQLTTLCKPDKTDDQEQELSPASNYANNYDHFTYSPETSPFTGVSCHAIDVVSKYCGGDFEYYQKNISDHIPVVIEIEI